MPARPVVAAFDFDGTLTERDSVVPFMRRVAGNVGLVAGLARRPVQALSALMRRDRDRLKALGVAAVFAGESVEVVDAEGERFAAEIERGWLRADTMSRLRWHLDRGDRVVLVSASLHPYLRPLGERLAVHGVLCSELEASAAGVYTGRLLGANCRGQEKVRRLTAWLGEERHDVEVWAYGDSAGDRELLAVADRPVWVKGLLVGDGDSLEAGG